MIAFVAMLAASSWLLGFLAAMSLWRRQMARDLAQVQRLDDAFKDYVAVVNRHEMPSTWK